MRKLGLRACGAEADIPRSVAVKKSLSRGAIFVRAVY